MEFLNYIASIGDWVQILLFMPKPVIVVAQRPISRVVSSGGMLCDSHNNKHNVIFEGETTRRLGVFEIMIVTITRHK